MIRQRQAILAVAVGHLLLSAGHGVAHATIPVHVPAWQYGYAGVVILLAPAVGAALFVGGRPAAGAWLLLLSGLAALGFEAGFHFLVTNPDHVSTVESGRTLFTSTAALTTVGDAALVSAAAWYLLPAGRRGRPAGSQPLEKRL